MQANKMKLILNNLVIIYHQNIYLIQNLRDLISLCIRLFQLIIIYSLQIKDNFKELKIK